MDISDVCADNAERASKATTSQVENDSNNENIVDTHFQKSDTHNSQSNNLLIRAEFETTGEQNQTESVENPDVILDDHHNDTEVLEEDDSFDERILNEQRTRQRLQNPEDVY